MLTAYRITVFIIVAGVGLLATQAFFSAPVAAVAPAVHGGGSETTIVHTPDDTQYLDGSVEYVTFYTQEGANSEEKIARRGMLVKKPDAQATVLISHGFMCDKIDAGFLRALFPDCNTFTFDFRAHGECRENQCCTLGRDEAYDVIGAMKYLKSNPELKGPFIAYGFSMGAVASIEAQAKEKNLFDAMILDCPFDSSENIIKRGLDNLKFTLFGRQFELPGRSLLQKYAFHPYVQALVKAVLKTVAKMDTRDINMFVYPVVPAESVKQITVPCFFIHCKNDQRVTIDAVKSIYAGARSDYKMLWLTNGRWHFDSFFYNPEKYTSLVKSFVHDVTTGALKDAAREKIIEDAPDTTQG